MKNDYSKYDFYNYKNMNDGKHHYFIKIKNEMVEIKREVYYVLYNSYRKQLRDNIKDQENGLISFDATNDDGYSLKDRLTYVSEEAKEDERLQIVMEVINTLNDRDKEIITELLINDREEKELAKQYQVARQTINKKKQRIINEIAQKVKKR